MPDPRPLAIGPPPGRSPEEVATHDFPVSRRGLDPDAVRRFLEEVADQLRELRGRESALHEALADAERRAADPQLDEATLSAKVGSETARVLQAAHEAANELVARAELRAAALEAEAGSVLAERTEAADREVRRLLAEAQARGEDLVEATKQECRAMVDEAREARRRILADLAARRRELHVQLEQLRAGKDALAGVVASVASSVDAVRARLEGSEEEARAAAEDAGRFAPLTADEPPIEVLVAAALAGQEEPGLAEQVPDAAQQAPDVVEPEPEVPVEPAAGEPAEAPADGRLARAGADGAGPGATPESPGASEGPEAVDVRAVLAAAGDESGEGPGEVVGEEEAASATASPVDELFAKIRASRAEELAHARSVLEEIGSGAPEEADAEWVGSGGPSAFGDDVPGDAHAAPPRQSAAGVGNADVLGQRDELLAPVLVELARAVKRVLRTEQNELLHALRHGDSQPSRLLPDEEATGRLAGAVAPGLASAWAAGAAFALRAASGDGASAGEGVSGPDGADVPGEGAVEGVAHELAEAVVGTLRQRLEDGLHAGEPDEAGLAELVGHAYREWKGERVEDVVGDFATSAFSAGLVATARTRGWRVAWLVDDGRDECPDCDDNAIAGPQPVGEVFPTGQAQPPVHPGCRCLLVPVSA